MLIVVEGVDRTGKTTLCEGLCERLRAGGRDPTLLHFSAPERDAVDEYVFPLADYWPGESDVVADRHYLGELVWPQIFGRESRMSADDRVLIERHLDACGAVCVWAWRDVSGLEVACADEPCAGKAGRAQFLFGKAVAESELSWILYVHGDDPDFILDKARRRERVARAQHDSLVESSLW